MCPKLQLVGALSIMNEYPYIRYKADSVGGIAYDVAEHTRAMVRDVVPPIFRAMQLAQDNRSCLTLYAMVCSWTRT